MDTKPKAPQTIDEKLAHVLENDTPLHPELAQKLKETPTPYKGMSVWAYMPWQTIAQEEEKRGWKGTIILCVLLAIMTVLLTLPALRMIG